MEHFPFHLAFPVRDLQATRDPYEGLLGCTIGRMDARWIDFNFWGHQLTAHLVDEPVGDVPVNIVDGHQVPVRHFGCILPWEAWHQLADKLQAEGISFIIAPYLHFEGQAGEQATMFLLDPSGNALEFKSFKNPENVLAK